MSAPRTTLILLAWNRWDLTARALDTLLECALDDCEILVVDNGSEDTTPQRLAGYAKQLRVLRLERNLGFVRGNNAGIAAAHPRSDIVLLNNDLVFTQHDWLARLRACVRDHPGCGIAGCRLVDAQGRLLHAGTRVLPDDGAGVQIASGRVEHDVGQYTDADRVVEGVVFAVAYIRRAVIDAIGVLHADYATYGEDSDYCLRARAAGWHTRLCGGVTLRHDQHGSTAADAARRALLLAQGRAVFARHWAGTLAAQYDLGLHVAGALDFPAGVAAPLRALLRGLDAAGVRLSYASLYAPVLPEAIAEDGDSHDHLLNALRRRAPAQPPPVALCVGDPALWQHVAADWRIGYADFEQLDAVEPALRAMDELWVPSAWHRDALQARQWSAPVTVVPWIVHSPYAHAGLRAPRSPHGERVVLCCARWDDIDAPGALLQAWTRRFRREQPLRLLLLIDAPALDLAAATRALALDPHGGRYSLLPRPRLAEEQQQAVYAAADVVVCASRSNRRSWHLLQALATVRPLIASARGARAELLQAGGGWPVYADDDAALAEAVLAQLDLVLADLPAAQARATRGRAALDAAQALTPQRVRARLRSARPTRPPQTVAPRRAQALVVLGMHRSGTSCVAGLLQLLGAYAGRAGSFLRHPQENALGFVERGDLHLACVAALRRRGGDWSVPLGWDAAAMPAARAQWRADWAPIRAELDAQGSWLIKEPRLCLLLEEIADTLAEPVLIQVVRAPSAVAASVQQRDGLLGAHALALWEHYNLAAAALRHGRRSIVVDYHSLLQQPRTQVSRLYRQLQEWGVDGLRLPDDEEIGAWISPQLARRQAAREPVPTPAQQQLWEALQQQVEDATAALPALSAASLVLLLQVAREHQARMQSERETQ